jgi:hypothetical protein
MKLREICGTAGELTFTQWPDWRAGYSAKDKLWQTMQGVQIVY